ncbi:hypothetical protein Emed_001640 [Eimeria media]
MPVIRRKRTTYHERAPALEAKGAPQGPSGGSPKEDLGAPTQGPPSISLKNSAWGPYGAPQPKQGGAPLNKDDAGGTPSAALRSKAAAAAAAAGAAAADEAKGAPKGAPSCIPKNRISAMFKKQMEGLSRGQRKRLAKKEACARRLNFGVYAEALLQQQAAAAAAADGSGGPSALDDLKDFTATRECHLTTPTQFLENTTTTTGTTAATAGAATTVATAAAGAAAVAAAGAAAAAAVAAAGAAAAAAVAAAVAAVATAAAAAAAAVSGAAAAAAAAAAKDETASFGFAQKRSALIFSRGPTFLGGPLSLFFGGPFVGWHQTFLATWAAL